MASPCQRAGGAAAADREGEDAARPPAAPRVGVGSRTRAAAGIGLMVTAVLLFVLMDTIAKSFGDVYAAQQLVWARYVFHLLLMLPLIAKTGAAGLVRTSRAGVHILRGALLAVATLCLYTALRYIPLADAYAVGFVSPLLVTVLSIPLLKERVGWRRWTAVAAGFVGVLIVIRPGLGITHPAVALPLVMAACFALYQVLTRRVSGDEPQLMMLFYTALAGTVALSLVVPFYWLPVAPEHWPWLGAMGALGGLGHLLLIRALGMAPASLLAPFVYTQIVWAIVIGYALFGDLPDAPTVVGMLIVIASGLYVFYREAVRGQRS